VSYILFGLICAVSLLFIDRGSSSHVLTWLLRGNPFTASSPGSGSIKFFAAEGHEVTVEVAAAGTDGFNVSLRSTNIALLVAIHLAVLGHIKVSSSRLI